MYFPASPVLEVLSLLLRDNIAMIIYYFPEKYEN